MCIRDSSDSDKTEKRKEPSKFDKPTRETDPDKTGIDTDADSTKETNINNNK